MMLKEQIPSGICHVEELKKHFKLLKQNYLDLYSKQGFCEKVSQGEWECEGTQSISIHFQKFIIRPF